MRLSSGPTVSEPEEDLLQEAAASEPTLDPLMLRPGPCSPPVAAVHCIIDQFPVLLPIQGFLHKLGERPQRLLQVRVDTPGEGRQAPQND